VGEVVVEELVYEVEVTVGRKVVAVKIIVEE
jgi:hypothetical protein